VVIVLQLVVLVLALVLVLVVQLVVLVLVVLVVQLAVLVLVWLLWLVENALPTPAEARPTVATCRRPLNSQAPRCAFLGVRPLQTAVSASGTVLTACVISSPSAK
jgi:hypothetical protein